MALAAEKAGAVGIRAEGGDDITAIRGVSALPIIGIRKHRYDDSELHITATRADVDIVAEAGAGIVALDGSSRRRPGGETLEDVVGHAKALGLLVMADLHLVSDAPRAAGAGVDYLGTTLVRASADDVREGGPNIRAVEQLVSAFPEIRVIGEGRYSTPHDIEAAFNAGAFSVVVGTAVTDSFALAQRLVQAAAHSLPAVVEP